MKNLLDQSDPKTEAMINSKLAQHLFQILAPGQSCVLDSRTKDFADKGVNKSTDSGMIILKINQSLFLLNSVK